MARGIRSVLSLATWCLVTLAGITSAADSGNVTFNGSNRLLFDVDGNHISTYALKIYCKHTNHSGFSGRLVLC